MTETFDEYEREQWRGRADAYAATFAHLCAHPAGALLDAAGVGAGCAVLDVGTGTGTVAREAWERGAAVTAVDAEPDMVAAARGAVPGAEVGLATLPELPYPDGRFDATVANFVLNHVGDPRRAAAEMRRVTRPGGRVAVTIWPYPAAPLQALWPELFAAVGAVAVPGLRLAEGLDFARTPEGLSGVLAGAGLREVTATTVEWTFRAEPEAWWAGPANGMGAAGVTLSAQSPEVRARIRDAYDARMRALTGADGRFALPTAAVLATGIVADTHP